MGERLACWTLDLEPDFQTTDSHEVLLDDRRFGRFEEFLLSNELPLSVFVVANMLENGLPVQRRFETIDPEFQLHSYSHDAQAPDSEFEIVEAKRVYEEHFGRPPVGYRAPNGDISRAGLEVLHREGFRYDASVFPAWRPELGYNFRKLPTTPFAYDEFPDLVELPFATIPTVRMVVSLSYLKLLGLGFYRTAFRLFGFPETLIFDSHLYDYFPTRAVVGLPKTDWRRAALMRNARDTMGLVQRFVNVLVAHGYRFTTTGALYERARAAGSLPQVPARALIRR